MGEITQRDVFMAVGPGAGAGSSAATCDTESMPVTPVPARTKHRRSPRLVAIAVAVALGAALASCAASDDEALPSSTTETTSAATDTTGDATATTAGVTGSDTEPGNQAAPAGCASRVDGSQRFATEAGGPTVEVRVFVPPDAGDTPLPVVLNWHGLGSDGTQQAILSAYEDLARDEGFLAVHPTGAAGPGDTRNSWELAQFDVPGRDDLAMVDDVIDRLITDFCADPDRIYSTGLSNGGFFTALLVCERADRIAAAASIAGVSHPDGCTPDRPVPYIAFHGTADEIVTFDGGRSALEVGPSDAASRSFFDQSMPEEFAEFAADFGCRPEPEPTPIGDAVTRNDYLGCDAGVPLSFFEIDGGGHTWPGSPLGPLLSGALGLTSDEVSATVDGWAFMSRFTLAPGEDG